MPVQNSSGPTAVARHADAAQPVTVSVVTPSYNQGRYLAATIESVLSQEGDFFLDYLVMDGGSTDDSAAVIRRYDDLLGNGQWPVRCLGIRYRWVSERDRGQSDAIIKGFGKAEGTLLAWLNSDDTYLPGALGRAVGFFREHPGSALLYGKGRYTDADGAVIGRYPAEPYDRQRLAAFNFICQPATFFSREGYDAAGGLDPELRYAMDYDLWLRLAPIGTIGYLPEFIATYRLHEESKTMSPSDSAAFHAEALRTVLRYYRWAPLNRVYGCCNSSLQARLPGLARLRPLLVFVSLCCTVVRYIALNRGVRSADLKMLNLGNLRKLSREWSELYKEY